jgi:6-phosphogluconolactonase
MKKILNLLIVVALTSVFGCVNSQVSRMYVGGYTGRDGNDGGLRIIDADLTNGTFTLVSEADAGPSPSYICISEKNSIIYAANESAVTTEEGARVGVVTALKLNADGSKAEQVKQLVLPPGGPVYVSLMPAEDFLLLAHYGAGAISVVRLDGNGLPMEVTDTIVFREEGIRSARGHMVAPSPDGKKVYISCLSLDNIMILDLDRTTGKLTQTGVGILPEGSGPRHFTFNKDGSKMYVINETAVTMTVFNVASDGSLSEIQTISTLPPGVEVMRGYSTADVHFSKDGKFLYGSNRGHNAIVTLKVEADGKLSFVGVTPCGGNHPRNFTLDPSGKFLLVANTNASPNPELYGPTPENIALFKIDNKTGLPVAHGEIYITRQPSCLKFIE